MAILASLLSLVGCSLRHLSPRVEAPAGSPYASAVVVLEKSGGSLAASDMGPNWREGGVFLILSLEGPRGAQKVTLDYATNSETARVEGLRRSSWRLEFAPDGHALAIARKGEPWSYVGLDVTPPLYCRHAPFEEWSRAPSTRALVLEILATSTVPEVTAGRSHADQTWELARVGRSAAQRHLASLRYSLVAELRSALAWVKAHPDDGEARIALADALALPGPQLDAMRAEALQVARGLAQSHADLRAHLIASMEGARFPAVSSVLREVPTAEVARAYARVLEGAMAEATPRAEVLAQVGWFFATNAASLASLALPQLEAVALWTPRGTPEAGARTGQRLAIHALAVLGRREVLEKAAAGPCVAYNAMDGSEISRDVLVPWTGKVGTYEVELSEDDASWSTAACHARAALAAMPR